MQAPPGYFFLDGMVCQLCRSHYGLKQPPRAWIEHFSIAIDVGFMPSAHDFALFHSSPCGRTFLLIYVDDMIMLLLLYVDDRISHVMTLISLSLSRSVLVTSS
jgi:hypothetical protein